MVYLSLRSVNFFLFFGFFTELRLFIEQKSCFRRNDLIKKRGGDILPPATLEEGRGTSEGRRLKKEGTANPSSTTFDNISPISTLNPSDVPLAKRVVKNYLACPSAG